MTLVARIDCAGRAFADGQAGLGLGIATMAAGVPTAGGAAATAIGAAVAGPGDVARRSAVQTPHRNDRLDPIPLAYLAAGHTADSVAPRPVMAACAATVLTVATAPLLLPSVRRLRLTPEPPASGVRVIDEGVVVHGSADTGSGNAGLDQCDRVPVLA
ncbi:hypothetical protein AB0L25_39280 [Spirillospora sp. NPDC052242]